MKRHYAVFLLITFVVIGCKLPGFLGGGGSGAGGKGTATGGSDPRADVVEASKRFIALPSFRANMEGIGQSEIKSQVDYQAPDRFHVKYLGGTGAGMEMIFIGKDGYMKSGDKWTKMPGGDNIPTLRDSFTEDGLKSLSDVKYEGNETVNGTATSAYTYKNVTPVGDFPFTSKMWVRNDTGVPLKIFVEYTNNQALKNMTINYDTDAKITIEPPIK